MNRFHNNSLRIHHNAYCSLRFELGMKKNLESLQVSLCAIGSNLGPVTSSSRLNLISDLLIQLQEEAKSIAPFSSVTCPSSTTRGISVLAGTGNIVWSGIYVIVSTIGLVVTVALLDIFYINPYVNPSYLWYKGLLFFLCMLVSVILFGGLVIGLWHCWDRKTSLHESENIDENETVRQYEPKMSVNEQYTNTVMYGQRPNFKGT